jgi:hydroxyethylthiazole kinase-like uncharacterized protein yjeF
VLKVPLPIAFSTAFSSPVAAHDVAAVRAAEGVAMRQVPEGSLMQRAAAGLATACLAELRARRGRVPGGRVVLLVGAGNNGGDALWAGARLAGRGARVDALLLSGSVHVEGLAALRASGGRATTVGSGDGLGPARELLARADLVVDGIVGLGGSPGLREPAASLVRVLDDVPRRPVVVAVDLPSGVDADGGTTPATQVRADVTVTFGTAKPCLLLPPAVHAAGRVLVVDVGLRPHLPPRPAVERLTGDDVSRFWPRPGPEDDKYTRGVVGVVAGSTAYTGAAVLAVGGALRAGAGMVRYVGPAQPAEQVRARWPEAVVGRGRVQAWVLGSGVDPGADDGQSEAVFAALAERLPGVVDAGAFAVIGRPDARDLLGEHLVLTPHAGELARLLSSWSDDAERILPDAVRAAPLAHARRAAELTGCTVLLKGSVTLVVSPDGRCRSQAGAPAWLATAGAGDVLAGVVGTLLAAGLDPVDAASAAAFVHGRSAAEATARMARQGLLDRCDGLDRCEGLDRAGGGGPVLAGDVVAALPETIAVLLRH